jgi:hypothetical protein
LYPEIGVVVVAGEADAAPRSLRLVLKWCPFEELLEQVWQAAALVGNERLTPALADGR